MSAVPTLPTPLSVALRKAPDLALRLAQVDLDIAVWRQRDRYYEIPPQRDPIISIHVGGAGRVRFGDGDGWSRRSSMLGTVTFLPPGLPTRWLVEGGAVEHLTLVAGPASPLRDVVTNATDGIEVGMPDALNVRLAQTIVEVVATGLRDEPTEIFLHSLCETLVRNFARLHRTRYRSESVQVTSPCEVSTRAIRVIEARFAEPLSVSELAAEAGLSPTHFSETFKKATGWTPHQYLLRVRVERVRDALRSTDMALARIAHNFGFSSQSHLNSAFRKLMGMTPSQYRQRAGEPGVRRQ